MTRAPDADSLLFTASETQACRELIRLALAEDLGAAGDITSQALIPSDQLARAVFRTRSPGTIAGLPAAALVYEVIEPTLAFRTLVGDGTTVSADTAIAEVSGRLRSILAGERVALNFLQRLSGVATRTRQFVEAVAGLPCVILDTRKTTPGWRLLEKYAVRAGGGHNHRMGLHDAVLIKDNHLAALGTGPEPIARAVRQARVQVGPKVPLQIEVDRLAQLEEALACQPDIVLLDNMGPAELREAARRRDAQAASVRLEASGGVTLANVRAMAETGVDRISVGALTHSAPALDIALDYAS